MPVVQDLVNELKETTSSMEDLRALSWKERKRAKKALELAKLLEENKKDHVWMKKEKTSKLVHPNNVKKNLADGWKISKTKKK